MGKLITVITILVFFSAKSYCQRTTSGSIAAAEVAQRMVDSLNLSKTQQNKIYMINMSLYNRRMALRKKYNNNVDSLTGRFQQIEDSRDSLYHTVLSDNAYKLYLSKKVNMLNNK